MEEDRIGGRSAEPDDASREIFPLNACSLSFDLDKAEIEELERRFEMALALGVTPAGACGGCPHLVTCGTFCSPPPPV